MVTNRYDCSPRRSNKSRLSLGGPTCSVLKPIRASSVVWVCFLAVGCCFGSCSVAGEVVHCCCSFVCLRLFLDDVVPADPLPFLLDSRSIVYVLDVGDPLRCLSHAVQPLFEKLNRFFAEVFRSVVHLEVSWARLFAVVCLVQSCGELLSPSRFPSSV